MVSPTLLASGVLSILTGLAFCLVARALSLRGATGSRRLARAAHATWWTCLGAYLVLQGALTGLAAFDRLTLEVYLASRLVAIPLLCTSVWGLTFYLAYLYTGRTATRIPLAGLYAGVGLLFFYATFSGPQALHVGTWIVEVNDDSPLYRLVYALVGVPPILGSLAYLALWRRAQTRAQRYRIVLVSGSILAYVGSGLAARLHAGEATIFVTLVVFGLGAAGASLAAYRPPRALRRALDLEDPEGTQQRPQG